MLEVSPLLGLKRTLNLHRALERVLHLPGDVAECGVGDGRTAAGLAWHVGRYGGPKLLHLFDSFCGLPDDLDEKDGTGVEPGRYTHTQEEVRGRLDIGGPWIIHAGPFKETLPLVSRSMCLVHADADLYSSTVEVIRWAKKVLVPGGALVVDDYRNGEYPGVTRAVDELLEPLVDGIQLVVHTTGRTGTDA